MFRCHLYLVCFYWTGLVTRTNPTWRRTRLVRTRTAGRRPTRTCGRWWSRSIRSGCTSATCCRWSGQCSSGFCCSTTTITTTPTTATKQQFVRTH
uniref:Secreted protein n=1 Tax=Panstrongylus lignarius TaxID=156445 RepID=A0A224XR86_9HEMI